jgi:hypothetical protein
MFNRDYNIPEFSRATSASAATAEASCLPSKCDGVCGRIAMVAFIGGEPIVIAESFAAFAEFDWNAGR